MQSRHAERSGRERQAFSCHGDQLSPSSLWSGLELSWEGTGEEGNPTSWPSTALLLVNGGGVTGSSRFCTGPEVGRPFPPPAPVRKH